MPAFSRADYQHELSRFRRRVPNPAVDQKIRSIGGAIANVTRLAWERALAHHDSPNEFPLPADPNCQERAFFAAFATLPKGELRRLARDAAKLLREPVAGRRQVLGDAAELDVKSPLTVVAQARSRPVSAALQITHADLESVLASHKEHRRANVVADRAAPPTAAARRAVPAPPPPVIPHARLVAKSIRCIRDSLEPGKDEIVLGGFFETVAFDLTTGDLIRPNFFPNQGVLDVKDLQKFKKGDSRDLGDLEIENIFLGNSADDLPLMPLVTLFMAEKDLFGFGLRMETLSSGLRISLIAPLISTFFLSGALGTLTLVTVFASASVLIQAAWIVGITLAVATLLRILGDDLFNANQMSVLVDAPDFTFPGGATQGDIVTLTYKRAVAHYELDVQWQLVAS
jgi:hypothetical protein